MQDTKEPQPEQKPEQTVQPVQPQQNFGPAPVDPNTQYQQQPVNQQYFAQPQAAPVQYVVMAPSLKGVKGWLLFFTICFALSGIGYISLFFASMTDLSSPSAILSLVFSPFLAAGSLATTVLIAMQKKLGKWLAVGTLGLYALSGVINSIIAFSSGTSSESTAPALLSAIIIGLVMEGLFMLYFFVSKRVKETLVN